MKKTLFVIFALFILGSSCSKYEDGPFISLRKKSKRLVNSWMYTTVLRNGNNITFSDSITNFAASSIGFNDEYRFTQIDVINASFVPLDGNWQFSENKDSLFLTYDDGNERSFLITRLKERSLHLEELIDNNRFEYEFLPNK